MNTTTTNDYAWIDRAARSVARHWLFLFNSVAVLYAGLPWISPALREAGYERLGGLIFAIYRFGAFCHQLPERSFFVGRHQVCYCHRCTALYTTVAVTGLLYGLIRWRFPLSTRLLLLAAVPILIDGLTHLIADIAPGLGLRSMTDAVGSLNFWLRMATGTIFGAAAILWLYPRIDQQFADV
jgi:uncharacterized membrane protein